MRHLLFMRSRWSCERQTLALYAFGILALSSCFAPKVELDPNEVRKFEDTLQLPRAHSVIRLPSDVPYLENSLRNPSATVRLNAAHDLESMGPQASNASTVLAACAASDKNAAVKKHCKSALIAVTGNPEDYSLSRVSPTLDNTGSSTPAPATSKEKMSPENSVTQNPTVKEQPVKVDISLVGRAAELALRRAALAKLEHDDPAKIKEWRSQLPYLASVISTGSLTDRETAVEILRYFTAYLEESIPVLRPALEDSDPGIQARTAYALGEARDSTSVKRIAQLLQSSAVRPYAAAALQSIGTAEARQLLKKAKIKQTGDEIAAATVWARGRPDINATVLDDYCRLTVAEEGAPKAALSEYVAACVSASASYY